mgnify:CR=1 FL=1
MLTAAATALARTDDAVGVALVGGAVTLLAWVLTPLWLFGVLFVSPLVAVAAPVALAPSLVARGYFVRVTRSAIQTGDAAGGDGSGVSERVVSQLLTELDRASDNPNLVVLAATNRRDALDPALLRPGRLETHVEVPEPDREARRKILEVHTRGKPLTDEVDLERVADETEGYSGAEIASLSRAAAMRAIERVADEHGEAANDHADEVGITGEDFDAALESVRPQTP